MLNIRELQPGSRCLYKGLTLSYECAKTTRNGHGYHLFKTRGGTEKRLSETETAKHVWMEITLTQED